MVRREILLKKFLLKYGKKSINLAAKKLLSCAFLLQYDRMGVISSTIVNRWNLILLKEGREFGKERMRRGVSRYADFGYKKYTSHAVVPASQAKANRSDDRQ